MTELHTHNLFVGYQKKTIVKNLSLTIPKGKIIGLIGPNGSGKSTLLKALARILLPQQGEVLLDNQTIQSLTTKEVAKKIALLPQANESGIGLTVREVISYGRFPYQKSLGRLSEEDYAAIDWALKATGLAKLADAKVNALSGGQRQRVWIALALAQDTDITILDEPTTFLDLAHQLEILNLLQEINQQQQKTIIMSIHDLNHASRFCDYLYALKAGQLIVEGPVEEVLTNHWLKELYEIDALLGTFPNSNKPLVLSYDLIRGENDES
ncbi:iron complex transport system ATP-binding protein [Enterococcus sp. PF1-24]|uniref:ABC transporter ATP-binding protein n=1 Tax=unclassified Enterococcus TaxID=2608891 RepID=UPI0024760EE7|nr:MULTISPECIES: ABC transporter ATP-binding protein [unclassified Enterococcus]MDH6363711.1 iron complex transport system ATP-binding protein [Enterococcus sp. PFB1-1]MDH6400667.1 iron complex transport system ATP-binding protein [Enterococcus sp. PF1-24]